MVRQKVFSEIGTLNEPHPIWGAGKHKIFTQGGNHSFVYQQIWNWGWHRKNIKFGGKFPLVAPKSNGLKFMFRVLLLFDNWFICFRFFCLCHEWSRAEWSVSVLLRLCAQDTGKPTHFEIVFGDLFSLKVTLSWANFTKGTDRDVCFVRVLVWKECTTFDWFHKYFSSFPFTRSGSDKVDAAEADRPCRFIVDFATNFHAKRRTRSWPLCETIFLMNVSRKVTSSANCLFLFSTFSEVIHRSKTLLSLSSDVALQQIQGNSGPGQKLSKVPDSSSSSAGPPKGYQSREDYARIWYDSVVQCLFCGSFISWSKKSAGSIRR